MENKTIKNKKKKKYIKYSIILGIVLLIIFLFFIFGSSGQGNKIYITSKVVKENIIQTVTETGTITAEDEMNLSFLNSGKIGKINFNIGDKVQMTNVLAELDYSSLLIRRDEAQASLDVAKNNLAKLLSGATSEDIAISRANVLQAKTNHEASKNELEKIKQTVRENISQAEKNVNDLLDSSQSTVTAYEQAIAAATTKLNNTKSLYQKSVDNATLNAIVSLDDKMAVAKTALDKIDTILNDDDAKDLISVKDGMYLTYTKLDYNTSIGLLQQVNNDLSRAKISRTSEEVERAVFGGVKAVNMVYTALKNCFLALENSITSSDFTKTELDNMKSIVSAQQTLISSAISTLQGVQQNLDDVVLSYETNVSQASDALGQARASYDDALKNVKNSLASAKISGEQQIVVGQSRVNSANEALVLAEAQLRKTLAPANSYDINLIQAQVRQAESGLSAVIKQIEDSIIRAPINGTITKMNYKVGEQVSVGQNVAAILGENKFEIEVLISEADIAKLKTDNKCQITLDAFGEDVKFNGHVKFIEPAETIIQEVVYYKAIVIFDNLNGNLEKIKSGMTTNVTITTDSKNNALTIPSRAIIDNGENGKFVRILRGKDIVEQKIETGIRGDDGLIEVVSGLSEGEMIVTRIEEK